MKKSTILSITLAIIFFGVSCLEPGNIADYQIPSWLEGEWYNESDMSTFSIRNNNIIYEIDTVNGMLITNYQGIYGTELEVLESSTNFYQIKIPHVTQEFNRLPNDTFNFTVRGAVSVEFLKDKQ